ncbi:nicotinate phosphoribosyltransferase [Aquirhabdus parva]|uniref:Nicotinamide phosphoribosyltransferase n=1 Tax=Aquirhabdus parva TaxID=2283318 RepID=A0A345P656_9GAMM|nr:nicotinate phosphoribosyltransferase [Aquirhabdus parva]AXI02765.1 nicotinate phosphoribosyltransferase [Aquirhabdus parva]
MASANKIGQLTNRLSNMLLNSDSYKYSHWLQYPPDTRFISSYIEPRGGLFSEVVFFGLQAFLIEYLSHPITSTDVEEAALLLNAHGVPFHRDGWQYIVDQHHGFLPIAIEALAEGTVLPAKNAVLQIVNTDPKCYWLTSFLETALLRAIWYPSTVASQSYACRQIIHRAMEKTCESLSGLPFKLHDFGARGVSSLESAALGGLGHLVNFMGTDTVSSLIAATRWYGMTTPEQIAGFSIPAAEHSTITSWGREGEVDAYRNMLRQFGGPGKILAVVSDSYDLWNAIDNLWGGELREEVKQQGGVLVIRPDSGDPVKIVRESLERLAVRFGYRINEKGYKVLPDYVRIIQGDGINAVSLQTILDAIIVAGFSVDNLAFGMGGGLLQQVDRDTLGWAMKASAADVGGIWRDVYKDPITSQAKRSKRGRLAVIETEHGIETIRLDELVGRKNLLQPIFENGKLLHEVTLTEIRKRAGWGD